MAMMNDEVMIECFFSEKSSIFISTWLLDGWDMPLVELSL